MPRRNRSLISGSKIQLDLLFAYDDDERGHHAHMMKSYDMPRLQFMRSIIIVIIGYLSQSLSIGLGLI